MTILDFILLLVIAGICGSIGQAIGGYSHGGFIITIVIGFIGAVIGSWLARTFSLDEFFVLRFGNTTFPIIWSIIGAAVFVAVLGMFTRPAKSRKS